MDEKLISQIDQLIEEFEPSLINDTIKLININSEQSEPKPKAPFGLGVKKVLDTVMEMGNNDGFYTTDYDVGVVSVAYKEGQPDLGIWAHGDVVPAGEGWTFEPYNAVVYKDCIIGRGATDNKGQLSAIYNLLRIFKKLNIKLNYNPALYVGSNEENGTKDMFGIPGNPEAKGFINVCIPPRLSLVPDSSFPLSYGARGMCYLYLKSKTKLHNFTLTAGLKNTPGFATAVFNGTNLPDGLDNCRIEKVDGKTKITTFSEPRHPSTPDPNGNMITLISSALIDNNLVNDEDRRILQFFKDISLDIHGNMFDINVETKEMSRITLYSQTITCDDGYPELLLNFRYPIDITYEQILERVSKVCEQNGFEVVGENHYNPVLSPSDTPVVHELVKIANSITGDTRSAYVNGITYAVCLPNAYTYGMNGCLPPEDFKNGRGVMHGVDESVSISRLKRAMRIYARALLKLNEIEW